MKVAVYDTHVIKSDRAPMHFDVVVPEGVPPERAIEYGREYLRQVGQGGQTLTSAECQFCHLERATKAVQRAIASQGYYVCKIEGCE